MILDYNSKLKLDRYLQPVLERAVPGRSAPEHGEVLEGRVRELVRRCFAEWMEKGMPPEGRGPFRLARAGSKGRTTPPDVVRRACPRRRERRLWGRHQAFRNFGAKQRFVHWMTWYANISRPPQTVRAGRSTARERG